MKATAVLLAILISPISTFAAPSAYWLNGPCAEEANGPCKDAEPGKMIACLKDLKAKGKLSASCTKKFAEKNGDAPKSEASQ